MCWDKKDSMKDVSKGLSANGNGKNSIHQPIGRSVLNAVRIEYFSEEDQTKLERVPRFIRFDW